MGKRIFVTGGSGFVGTAVVKELLARDFEIVALVNRKDVRGARSVRADVHNRRALVEGMAGCEAAIHLIGIIAERPTEGVTFQRIHVEATRAVVTAAREAGVRRYAHMSALGSRPDAGSEYHRTKWQAEEIVRGSGLGWTIIRPSLIHGPRGEFMRMEAKWARRTAPPYFFMPYFGRGLVGLGRPAKIQPVFVDDVAQAFADAVEKPGTIGKVYELGGPRAMAWPEMHHVASRVIVGRRRPAVAIPAWYAKMLTRILPPRLLPFSRDQVTMCLEDNTCDLADFRRDFGREPADFEAALTAYAGQL